MKHLVLKTAYFNLRSNEIPFPDYQGLIWDSDFISWFKTYLQWGTVMPTFDARVAVPVTELNEDDILVLGSSDDDTWITITISDLRKNLLQINLNFFLTEAGERPLITKAPYNQHLSMLLGARVLSGATDLNIRVNGSIIQTVNVTTTPTDISIDIPIVQGDRVTLQAVDLFTNLEFTISGERV